MTIRDKYTLCPFKKGNENACGNIKEIPAKKDLVFDKQPVLMVTTAEDKYLSKILYLRQFVAEKFESNTTH